MTQHVVIGGGPSGINAIETIRQFDADARITLVADEAPYARMALPYFLAGDIPQRQLTIASDKLLDALRVERLIGRRAQGVDGAARRVHLDNGETLAFDSLLVATGSSPAAPPIPGADGTGVHTLWTLGDAQAVLKTAKAARPSAVLVGAGFIGMIVLNAMHKLGWKLAVVELAGQILPRMLDRQAAAACEDWLRERGIPVYTGCVVTEIAGPSKKAVHLSDGQVLRADMVILSTGIRPNVSFLEGSGVRVEAGVVIDDTARTNVPGIYAAGDVAQGPNLLGGPSVVHAIQPTAVDHGRIAGANIAGHPRRYAGSLLMNVLDVAGLHCASFGRWHETADTTTVWNASAPIYRKLVWDGRQLVGGIIVGPADDSTMLTDVGMVKGLIQARGDLGDWKAYLHERPWDLRRVFVASRTAEALLSQMTLGLPSAPRGFRFKDAPVPSLPSAHHGVLVKTKPKNFGTLPRTPTPGIYKAPVSHGDEG